VADDRPVHEALLDILVYIPIGAAIAAAAEVPKLAERGRDHFEKQIATARVLGKFAVAEGRRRVTGSHPAASGKPTRPTDSPVGAPRSSQRPAGRDRAPTREQAATAASDRPEAPQSDGQTAARPPAASPGRVPGRSVPSAPSPRSARHGAARSLPIPGYDTLAASQVVERLAALSGDELEAVRAYEAAGRRRRTVLHRIAQLNAERDNATA